jgi:hypothetical protein
MGLPATVEAIRVEAASIEAGKQVGILSFLSSLGVRDLGENPTSRTLLTNKQRNDIVRQKGKSRRYRYVATTGIPLTRDIIW